MKLLDILKAILPFVDEKEQLEEIIRSIEPKETILEAAESMLGKDASPRDYAPDDLGCAESVANILHAVDPSIDPLIVSTAILFKILDKNPNYERVLDIEPGCILVSPTGYQGSGGALSNGHTGIFLTETKIASNSSASGLWEQNYTLNSWIARYRVKGKYPLYVFKYKG